MPIKVVTIYSEEQPTNGIVSTLQHLGATTEEFFVVNWQPQRKPVYDMFEEIKPDIIVADATKVPNLTDALKEFGTKLVTCGDHLADGVEADLMCYSPRVSKSILTHGGDDYYIVKPASNSAKYRNGEVVEDKKVDVLIFSPTSEYTQEEINAIGYVSEMGLRFKIIGHKRPFIEYAGAVSVYETADFFASASIVIDVNNHCLFDVAAQGGFCISNKVNDLYPHVGDFQPDILKEQITDWLNKPDDRAKMGKSAKKKTKNQTYFHRTAEIFHKLGYEDLETAIIKYIEQVDK